MTKQLVRNQPSDNGTAIVEIPPSAGAVIVGAMDALVDEIQNDVASAVARRQFEGAQRRLNEILSDFERFVAGLKARYSKAEASLLALRVMDCRAELTKCYSAVSIDIAKTKAGQERIAAAVDALINETLKQIDQTKK